MLADHGLSHILRYFRIARRTSAEVLVHASAANQTNGTVTRDVKFTGQNHVIGPHNPTK